MSRYSKNILISFMLLIFVGQTAASNAIAYLGQQSNQSSSMGQSTSTSNHSNAMYSMHNMPDSTGMSDSTDMSDSMKNCCTLGSDCSMSGCILMAIPHVPVILEMSVGFQKILLLESSMVQYSPSSLFRPPILA